MISDEVVMGALRKCLEEAIIPAAEVAERLGVSTRYAKDRLLELKEKEFVEGKYHGNVWCFRPK